MNKETLRMQMLAGLITESEYKSVNEELNESDEFFNYYIAKVDTQVKGGNSNKKIAVPKGTVIYARGLGRWVSVDGEIKVGIEDLKGNPDFDFVNNMTWPNTLDLTDNIEAWSRKTNELIQNDPNNIQKIIADRAKIIDTIRKMLV
jgi:hypothetical protein